MRTTLEKSSNRNFFVENLSVVARGGSGSGTSMMEFFVTIINGF